MVVHYIYVVHRASDGLRKIGFSRNPQRRLCALAKDYGCTMSLEEVREVAQGHSPRRVELAIHHDLSMFRCDDEFFAVTLRQAQAALRKRGNRLVGGRGEPIFPLIFDLPDTFATRLIDAVKAEKRSGEEVLMEALELYWRQGSAAFRGG